MGIYRIGTMLGHSWVGLTWIGMDWVLFYCRPALHLWIADQVRNDVCVVAGGCSVWRVPILWIDEPPMNLCEILGFQPKGVNTLSFSSR